MKKYNLFAFILLSFSILSCEDKKNNETFFAFDPAKLKTTYVNADVVTMQLTNAKNKTVDSVVYYVNDKRIKSGSGLATAEFPLKDQKLGYQNLKALVFFEGETTGQEVTHRIEIGSSIVPKPVKYTIVNTYPHDVTSFTQGLEFYRDTLIESTGQNGKSYIRKYDYKTGKVYQQVDLDQLYFGEGITVFDNKIYQLTWQSKIGFIYNADNLKKIGSFDYDKPIEGWGITHDGNQIYQSDGTEKIWTMDPKSHKLTDYVNVYSSNRKIKSVNELEWINGKIFGNIWGRDAIAVIDPTTGSVTGVIDLRELRKQITHPKAEAFNGIAYNPRTKTIFVTGKNWDKMFEIRIEE